MWDAVDDEVFLPNFEGEPFICQSDMQDSNLEAVMDSACIVEDVDFVITSDDPDSSYSYGRTEFFSRYLLYGNIDNNILPNQYDFPAGDYTVTATALLEDGSSMEASLQFEVLDC